ncbi:hypothetical protein DHD80_18410 [Gramella sp. AN32]|nr:hypothetical protein [Gramella sp. AN32]
MNPPQMMASTMETSIIVGWIIHLMIGIIFALIYAYLIFKLLTKVSSTFVKGIIFGIIAFVIGEIGMLLMGAMMPEMPMPQGNMIVIASAGLIGHIIFGIVVAYIVKPKAI